VTASYRLRPLILGFLFVLGTGSVLAVWWLGDQTDHEIDRAAEMAAKAARIAEKHAAYRRRFSGTIHSRDFPRYLKEMPPLPLHIEKHLVITPDMRYQWIPREYFEKPVWLRKITPLPIHYDVEATLEDP